MASELLTKFKGKIQEVTLIPDSGGKFEVTANDQLVYSKLQTGRHAEPAEVLASMEKIIG